MSPCEMFLRPGRAAGLLAAAPLALLLATLGGTAAAAPATNTITVTHTPPVLTSLLGDFKTTVTVTGHCEYAHFVAGASAPPADLVNMDGFLWGENGIGPGDYSFSFVFQGRLFDAKKDGSALLAGNLWAIVQHDAILLAEAAPDPLAVPGIPKAFSATVDFIDTTVEPSGIKWLPSDYTVTAQITLTMDPALAQIPAADFAIIAGGLGWSPVADFPAIEGQEIGPVTTTGNVTLIPVEFTGTYYDALPCMVLVGCVVDVRPGNSELVLLAAGAVGLPQVDY